jgi:hypothetical protein
MRYWRLDVLLQRACWSCNWLNTCFLCRVEFRRYRAGRNKISLCRVVILLFCRSGHKMLSLDILSILSSQHGNCCRLTSLLFTFFCFPDFVASKLYLRLIPPF